MIYRLIHCAGFRLFEIVMTGAMLGLGCWVVIWPGSIGESAFRAVLEIFGVVTLTLVYLSIGVSRAFALYVNGSSFVWGPIVRAVGALGSAGVLFQMDMALVRLHFDNGSDPSPGIPIFTALVCGELISTYRAAADVRPSPRNR